jgi:hypothetical protein
MPPSYGSGQPINVSAFQFRSIAERSESPAFLLAAG